MNSIESSVMISVNNYAVSYFDEGPIEGRVVIFIHGFPINKSMGDIQITALKGKHRLKDD